MTTKNAATQLIEILEPSVKLFCDPLGVAWVGIPINQHLEFMPIRSKTFGDYMGRRYFETQKKSVNENALSDAKTVFCGKAATFPPREIFTRIAHHGGKVYIDLGDSTWRVVEIQNQGDEAYQVIDKSPVPFHRPHGMRPLPLPVYDSDAQFNLNEFINLDENNFKLLLGWILGTYADCDFPVLVLNGEQGSGKSTITKILRFLIDPHKALTRSTPRDEQNLMLAARNSRVLAFDNLSSIPDWLSDAFCRISTGAGWATRQLYSDFEESIVSVKRPIILNGITDLITRPDLLDRSIMLTVPQISNLARIPENEFWKRFNQAQPYILSNLYRAVSRGIRVINNTHLASYPRMADFARWVVASAPALDLNPAEFLDAYQKNRDEADMATIENSIVCEEIQTLIETRANLGLGQWQGTALQLLEKLSSQAFGSLAEEKLKKMNPRSLVNEIKRYEPVLRKIGIQIEFKKPQKINGKTVKHIEITNLHFTARASVKVGPP